MTDKPRACMRETAYRGWRAVEMESEQITLTIVPELGGKIVSLCHKASGKMWLVDSGGQELGGAAYGAEFTAADMCGWDECFPTIVACSYPAEGSFKDRRIPDHGELWAVPWEANLQEGALSCKASGRQLPYEFQRDIHFHSANTVRLTYRTTNRSGSESLSVLWAAHPQFIATEHTQIRLPADITSLLCVDGGRSLETGRRYVWPEFADGERRLDGIGPAAAHDCRKFYVEGQVKEGWAQLYERNSGDYVKLKWLPKQIPYLGIWIDEGRFSEQAVCALEPSSGYYDSLAGAYARNRALRIGPGETKNWHLDVELGC